MEVLLSWTVGILFAISIFLLLNKNLIRVLFGIILIGTSINLMIFTLGRLSHNQPVFLSSTGEKALSLYANALPQALILTAIVISFGVVSYALVLITRTWQELGTMDSDQMRESEHIETDK